MIFLRYESFGQYIRRYKANSLILLINILAFVATLISYEEVILKGALITSPPANKEVWRLVTSMFLHGGWGHFLFNTFAIFVFAPPLEYLLGHGKYLLLYLGSGVMGNLLSLFTLDFAVSIGASGAVYGIFGAYVAMILMRRPMLDESSRRTVWIILGLGVLYTLLPTGRNINWIAHLGGFVGGFMLYSNLGLRRK